MPPVLVSLISDVVLLICLAALAWIDLRQFRLPDALTLPLVLLGLGLSLTGHGPAPLDAAIGAAAGFAVFWALGATYFRLRKIDGLGLGDAKLMAAAGAWVEQIGMTSAQRGLKVHPGGGSSGFGKVAHAHIEHAAAVPGRFIQ